METLSVSAAPSIVSDGYTVLDGVFTEGRVRRVQRSLLAGLGAEDTDDLGDVLLAAEAVDHSLVYNAGAAIGSSAAAYELLGNTTLTAVAAHHLQTSWRSIHFLPLHVAVQIPQNDWFDYRWHQESAFYPWAEHVLSVWFPVLDASTAEGGTMAVIPGSHRGGRRDATRSVEHGSLQIEAVLAEGELECAVPVEIAVGDAIVFDSNLVHASLPNLSERPRVTGILRIVDQRRVGVKPIVTAAER